MQTFHSLMFLHGALSSSCRVFPGQGRDSHVLSFLIAAVPGTLLNAGSPAAACPEALGKGRESHQLVMRLLGKLCHKCRQECLCLEGRSVQ